MISPTPFPIKLDTNRAWQSAHAAIMGNREAVLAVAGVFFFLPALALALLHPAPPLPSGQMTPDQMMGLLRSYYAPAMPLMVISAVGQILGAMAILRLFTQSNRPTVRDALGKALGDTLVFTAVSLATGLAALVILVLVAGLGGVAGGRPGAAVALLAAGVGLLYVSMRVILAMPAIAVEGLRNPVTALQRSWVLTRGNAGRILLFLVLLMLAFTVIQAVVGAVLGLAIGLIAGTKGTTIGLAVVLSAFNAIFTVYLTTSLAAIHRQLAGPTPAEIGATFD